MSGIGPVRAPALRRLTRVLIGYGIVGLIVAALALVGLVVGVGRVNGFADRFGGDLDGIARTLERTSEVMDAAATSADSFGTTIQGTTSALATVGGDIDSIAPRLDSIAEQTAAINILGSNPLSSVSGLFRDIAAQLRDVRGQLATVATGLGANQTALAANATSLAGLATETRQLSARLNGSSLTGAIDDLRVLLVIVLGIGALGAAVPAVGALLAGLWLWRELAVDENAVSPIPG
ncbi:MAG TPA: hypothetical protein VFI34_01205 [Candidatus Limnocylindrales bacterium]|nr:hypothetical protein [Candidatus Limnocylindrales bacterium]